MASPWMTFTPGFGEEALTLTVGGSTYRIQDNIETGRVRPVWAKAVSCSSTVIGVSPYIGSAVSCNA